MTWIFEKFLGDAAIYSICPKCGFYHMVGSVLGLEKDEPISPYPYCPMCGKYLMNSDDTVEVIWNERHIEELWYSEESV